jgi:hypothetical protein
VQHRRGPHDEPAAEFTIGKRLWDAAFAVDEVLVHGFFDGDDRLFERRRAL